METKKQMKRYEIIRDCFVGKKGQTILVNWDAYDGAYWENEETNECGNPFAEMNCVKAVKEQK